MTATPQGERLMDLRYGLFLHWNPSSVVGHEISWSREGPKREIMNKPRDSDVSPRLGVPAALYDTLYRHFNASRFDAPALVAKARRWGHRYVYITTKHHDGFAMFDSARTDYKVTAPDCPAGRDLTRELADACHAAGMGFGVYHSQPDWHHPDYRTENHDRYVEYLHAMVEELCTGYGPIAAWWFDGLAGDSQVIGRPAPPPFERIADPARWDAEALIAKMRRWQPDMAINERCALPCDFDTPEQRVGDADTGRPWESTITLDDQWAYRFQRDVKSAETVIGHIVDAATGGGNFVVNVGPDRLGVIPAEQERVLDRVGLWLDRYGHTIYGTRAGPWPRWIWGGCTARDDTVWLHVRRWAELDDTLRLPLGGGVLRGEPRLLTPGRLRHAVEDGVLHLALPLEDHDGVDAIVEVAFDAMPRFG
ncbi:alpha-L-fucosidase [Jannaschia sp. LMIT008]|uniref:alpha-L-fucosidase n=1 Tax=Jannaschia maritima TaxID=3032585 RepID=UPI002810AA16|nr:alpha-L-fucosidase [Jannaschia sp. LMIT008]